MDRKELAATVRAALKGGITRQQLPGLELIELGHIAFAIMLARPDDYLEIRGGKYYVKGHIAPTLEDLVILGVPYEEEDKPSEHELRTSCSRAGLYVALPGKGGRKPAESTPPDWLARLVHEYGGHPAVEAFHEEVQQTRQAAGRLAPEKEAASDPLTIEAERIIAGLRRDLHPILYYRVLDGLPKF